MVIKNYPLTNEDMGEATTVIGGKAWVRWPEFSFIPLCQGESFSGKGQNNQVNL